MRHKDKLAGVFAPVVTPFRDEVVDLDALQQNLRRLNETELTGYLALGSNGEFRSLTAAEQLDVLTVFAEECAEKVVMAGTGAESTAETIERSHAAADMGFAYVSVLTPSYFAKHMDGAALRGHYERIADRIGAAVVLYNAPGFTGGVQLDADTVCALAAHENIAGMKDSSPVGPGRFLSRLDPGLDFAVLAGSADFVLPSLYLGAAGGILSLANIVPEACCRLYRLFRENKHEEARALGFTLSRLNHAIAGTWGVAGVKAAMTIMGYAGGEPRRPLTAVPAAGVQAIRAALQEYRP